MAGSSAAHYSSLEDMMNDGEVSEIMVNGHRQVFVEKSGKMLHTDFQFRDAEALLAHIQSLFQSAGKSMSSDMPYGDATLPDGTRLNVILPPVARQGGILTIRKFMHTITSIDDLIECGTITRQAADLLIACIRGRLNIFFSGGTGVGKTTTLQILSSFIDPGERIIIIEDTSELRLSQEHLVNLETLAGDRDGRGRVTLRDLIRNSLRMRPDRLIFGETRSEEALDIVTAMATGHNGCLGVIHGSSPRDVLARLETMVMMSNIDLPLLEVRKMITSNINLVVHQERMTDGTKKITHITEIEGVRSEDEHEHEIKMQDLFRYQIDRVDADGRVIGVLKSVISHYPGFFNRFDKIGLDIGDIFEKDIY